MSNFMKMTGYLVGYNLAAVLVALVLSHLSGSPNEDMFLTGLSIVLAGRLASMEASS